MADADVREGGTHSAPADAKSGVEAATEDAGGEVLPSSEKTAERDLAPVDAASSPKQDASLLESREVLKDTEHETEEGSAHDSAASKVKDKPAVEEKTITNAEELVERAEEGEDEKHAAEEQLSDNESYHSPGEDEYKSESDDASGLLRGRRREASDEEDEEDDDEDGASVTDEENKQEHGGVTSGSDFKGEGAYESDGAQAVEKTDGDADDEGADILDDESNDLDEDEGKAEEEVPAGEEPEAAPKAEVKKPAEPFVVPTAGPFYMHDDRFGAEETKRPSKGKKLWEGSGDSTDKWPHDMFEKLSLANDAPPLRREDGDYGRGRRRGGRAYDRGGRGEAAFGGFGGNRGGRGGGRGGRSGPDGGRRNFAAMQSAPGGQPQTDPALLPTPPYDLELLQEFPPPQTNAQNWGGQQNPSRQNTENGTSNYDNSREHSAKSGQNARGNSRGGQKATTPAWAESEPEAATGWGDDVQERGSLASSRGRGGRGAEDGQNIGRGSGGGRGEVRPRSSSLATGEGHSSARGRGQSGWGSAPGGQQPTESQGGQAGYSRGGVQPTGWDNRPPARRQERAAGPPQGRSATVGTMTSPRPLEQVPSREESRPQYQPPELRAARREIEVQTDLAPEVSTGPRNAATTPRGGAAKSGPPPGFASNSGGTAYGTSVAGGADYGSEYRPPVNAAGTGRSSPSLHLANEYVPNAGAQQVLPYGQAAVPPVGGYSLPPYPSHLPPYAYGSSEVTWVPVLNNPQGNALPPPPNVYGANPYASPYTLGAAEATPYMYSSQAVAPPDYAAMKQGLAAGPAISRPPSASTLWKPPASAGLSTGALEPGADAYGQRQSKPRRYTEMTFQ